MADDFTPLRVAILTSHGAPGLAEVIRHQNRGAVYDVAAVIGSETSFAGMAEVEAAGIPLLLRPIHEFHKERGLSWRNVRDRSSYDEELAAIALELRVDYLVLAGYNYVVSQPLLEAFEMHIVAMHDGDLTVRDEYGRRRYSGPHAVREAIFAGEDETRSSAYFATADVGGGPLFLLSGAYPVSPLVDDARERGDAATLSGYADLHRRWMVESSWGRIMQRAFEFLAAGNVQVVRDLVWIDGVPGPCRMGDAPSICHKVRSEIDAKIPRSCPLIRE